MFKKILIANRGEIACRVAATARRLGVRTVAVYSDTDAHARHVRACDEAVHLGGSAPRDSYLQWQRIIEAALATGAQAIHPGYGFLSENEDFALACAAAGLVFIGPPAAAIAAMGSKSAAKALMDQAGVPLVPGYHGDNNDPAFLAAQADAIGYPVLIKASAGGGGKGMRRVDHATDFAAALASCQRESKASFGNDHVLIERYVTRPRHIEIQVFGDSFGRCVYLFERDCSVQRRHQKVLEEAPAPGMSEQRRAEMGAAAVSAAQAVGYVGAGTVEFIAEESGDGDLRFYFMEMNTRLQVEHPVTEAITGLDLVEWQLRVADGEPLPLAQEQLTRHGHAIEARICAENPEGGFLPATGTLQVARWPAHVAFQRNADGVRFHDPAAVRIDRGFDEGDTISPWYDSMIAKLIVWGEDRAQALARLDAALRDTHLMGLHNNVAFLRRVAASHAFATADLDTALIEREHTALFEAPPLAAEVAAAAVVAHRLATEARMEGADPWSRRDGWRLHGGAQRRLSLEVQGRDLTVLMERLHDGATVLQIGDQRWPFTARVLGGARHDLQLGEQRITATVYAQGERHAVFTDAGSALVNEFDPIAHAGEGATEGRLTAPMPGKVVSFFAQPGDRVQRGQALAVMEAMKMEHTLHAPHDGVVAELLYAVGDQVLEGGELLRLAPS
ncbi:MAG: acetyl/propionyl/methylcrotonyl-CoA carboxylase subunit alpha [Rubrivivax sp.]|jgi:3-methylcrotonyl-CoA carboxylase alpha subunit|nr:acetyl/propionyl/methylcrotonyl-CoA carboxylase subunit alpha [Betaproteobacteria bacterium]MBP6320439.1 acetyl/propionyl/methylcrotonyl-CoA carboxylase subunit alpha [Rubrivivax sp.]MBK7277668.1 acetyl/propionyl/methylcrotonyl-CoA carboxylase subunit alpha [Betaproteobacteria bacterium]MBK7514209.1 acetyl/propionyl/methylcrotonyl-CoA carboxylase subunit alpha [Betaproteobacteria bacterium]MBK8105571.1 acetyl/propionyl/methylcrotonyl-CoA carboxylase subunit alpha [Betaproteobacteria bacteriu